MSDTVENAPEASTPGYTDDFFGDAAECAEDARFVKRLSLIVVPLVVLLGLITVMIAQAA